MFRRAPTWRGVMVTSLEGQLLSQKPHSMHRLTRGSAGGEAYGCRVEYQHTLSHTCTCVAGVEQKREGL